MNSLFQDFQIPSQPIQKAVVTVSLAGLTLTVAYLATYLLPSGAPKFRILPSLIDARESPEKKQALSIYPEDFYDGGRYLYLPLGRVRYWIVGPDGGKKVRPEIHPR